MRSIIGSVRALVTGGAGFIGSHIVEALLSRGDDVRVLDDLSTGKRENLPQDASRFEFVEGSVTDPTAAAQAVEGCKAVFHLAAVASVQKSVEDPIATGRVNTEGTVYLLEAAAKAGAKVVLSSSSALYGDSDQLPLNELELPQTLSPYAVHKLGSEAYLRAFHATHGLKCVSLRYFNVYGPRQDPDSEYAAVIPKFVTRALLGQPLVIFGDGKQTRDFVYVSDVARANLLAVESSVEDGRPVNIGFGQSFTVRDLAELIIELSGSASTIEHLAPRQGEVKRSQCDLTAARELIGFEAAVSLEEGLRETIDDWRSRLSS